MAYVMVGRVVPDAFAFTLGPASGQAMTEAVASLFYVTLLIARLVAIYSAEGPSELRSR